VCTWSTTDYALAKIFVSHNFRSAVHRDQVALSATEQDGFFLSSKLMQECGLSSDAVFLLVVSRLVSLLRSFRT
jgi:hypothetical protein